MSILLFAFNHNDSCFVFITKGWTSFVNTHRYKGIIRCTVGKSSLRSVRKNCGVATSQVFYGLWIFFYSAFITKFSLAQSFQCPLRKMSTGCECTLKIYIFIKYSERDILWLSFAFTISERYCYQIFINVCKLKIIVHAATGILTLKWKATYRFADNTPYKMFF